MDIIPQEEGWMDMQNGIDKMIEKLEGGSKLNMADWFATYTMCYDMCTQRTPYNWSNELYRRHGTTTETYLTEYVLPPLRRAGGSTDLLIELENRWAQFQLVSKHVNQQFAYLDRYYVKHHELPTLRQAAMARFRTQVYDVIKSDVTDALLDLINAERDGEVIDKSLVISIVDFYESLGNGTLQVYTPDLEGPLLQSTRFYYAQKRQEWIATATASSTPEYPLLMANAALDEERHRVIEYLDESTESILLKVVEEEIFTAL